MSRMADAEFEVRMAIEEIRTIQAAYTNWTEENEDLAGKDDASWYDTIAWYDQQLGDAGIKLANLIENLMGG